MLDLTLSTGGEEGRGGPGILDRTPLCQPQRDLTAVAGYEQDLALVVEACEAARQRGVVGVVAGDEVAVEEGEGVGRGVAVRPSMRTGGLTTACASRDTRPEGREQRDSRRHRAKLSNGRC